MTMRISGPTQPPQNYILNFPKPFQPTTMTPVTSVQPISDTNNNNRIDEELEWSQADNNEDNHVFTNVIITILRLKSKDVSDLAD